MAAALAAAPFPADASASAPAQAWTPDHGERCAARDEDVEMAEDAWDGDEAAAERGPAPAGRKRGAPSFARATSPVWQLDALRTALPPEQQQRALSADDMKRARVQPFVVVKTLSGASIKVEPLACDRDFLTVADLKLALYERNGIEPHVVRLLWNKRVVSHLDALVVETGAVLHLIAAFGGCVAAPEYAPCGGQFAS